MVVPVCQRLCANGLSAEPAEGLKFNQARGRCQVGGGGGGGGGGGSGRGTCPLPGEAQKLFKYMKLIDETRLFF